MELRPARTEDIETCGRIIYEAFRSIGERHNFPLDFPTPESGLGMAEIVIGNPDIYGVVAEENGRLAGSNFLWEMDEIAGVGPITIAPDRQANGLGRKLMEAVIERGSGAPGIRLVQDAFNTASLSLYASLGFEVVEPLIVIEGTPRTNDPGNETAKTEVRELTEADLDGCDQLCRQVHGFARTNDLRQISRQFGSYVAVREGRITAYASAPNIWQLNHAVAVNTGDMQALLAGAARLSGRPLAFLLPTRQAELFRWCLDQGLRVVKPMTLMAMGDYREPRGSFLPSVLY